MTLVAGGVLLALFGSFLLPYSVSPATHAVASVGGTVTSSHVLAAGSGGGLGQLLSVGLLVVLIANPLLSLAGFWMVGTRVAALAPLHRVAADRAVPRIVAVDRQHRAVERSAQFGVPAAGA